MDKRDAKKHALRCASRILDTTLDTGWPYDVSDWNDEECVKVAEAMREIVYELDRRGTRRGKES